jgi:hypothetical protein
MNHYAIELTDDDIIAMAVTHFNDGDEQLAWWWLFVLEQFRELA